MDPQKQKEQFNYAYMCALAAHAGLNRVDTSVDDDSIDVSFKGKGYVGHRVRSPQIEFQLKCTAQDIIKGTEIKFSLSRKNYDDLRGNDFACPRYLAVMLVPIDVNAWVDHATNNIALFNNCYWLSLKDAGPTGQSSITVTIPLAQRITSKALREMMDRASEGEWL
jgi:hypothetical protein